MGPFPEDVIQEVLDRLDALKVLHKINYRPDTFETAGDEIRAFCPIHRETLLPTLVVHRLARAYHCSNVGCQGASGGDLIDLYAKSMGLTHERAVLELAATADPTFKFPPAPLTGEEPRGAGLDEDATLLIGKAELLRASGRSDQAAEVYGEVVETFRRAGRFEQAAAACQRLVDLQPASLEHRNRQFELAMEWGMEPVIAHKALALADFHQNLGEPEQAAGVIERALVSAGACPELYEHGGLMLEQIGLADQAAVRYLQGGRLLLARGDHPESRRVIERGLACRPDHCGLRETHAELLADQGHALRAMHTYHELAEEYLAAGKHEATIRVAHKLLALDPDHLPSLQVLAKAYGLSGQEESRLSIQLRLLRLYQQTESYTHAAQVCDEILSARPDSIPALEHMVEVAEATYHAERLVEGLWRLAQVYAGAERRKEEQGVLERLLDEDPRHIEAWSRYLEGIAQSDAPLTLADAIERCIRAFEGLGRPDQAARILESLSLHCPHGIELCEALVHLYQVQGDSENLRKTLRRQAEQLHQMGRLRESLRVWDELDRLIPHNTDLARIRIEIMLRGEMKDEACREYARLGEDLLSRRRFEEAEEAFRAALRIDPDLAAPREQLISMLIDRRQLEKALEAIDEAASRCVQAGRIRQAIQLLERIFELDPLHGETCRVLIPLARRLGERDRLARYYLKLLDSIQRAPDGDADAFAEAAREAVEQCPDDVELRSRLADFHLKGGQTGDAEKSVLALVEMQQRSGRTGEAHRTLKHLLELGPHGPQSGGDVADPESSAGETTQSLEAREVESDPTGRSGPGGNGAPGPMTPDAQPAGPNAGAEHALGQAAPLINLPTSPKSEH